MSTITLSRLVIGSLIVFTSPKEYSSSSLAILNDMGKGGPRRVLVKAEQFQFKKGSIA